MSHLKTDNTLLSLSLYSTAPKKKVFGIVFMGLKLSSFILHVMHIF